MQKTKLLYLTDSYKQTATATVVDVVHKSHSTGLVLDQTIFYPQGGGQPSDTGTIQSKTATLEVAQVDYHDGQPVHWGKAANALKKGDSATLTINWDRRFHNMRLHSAGHLLHEAVMQVAYGIEPVSGIHGIGGKNELKYKGIIDHTLLDNIQEKLNTLLTQNLEITTKMVSLKKLQEDASWVPENLPKNKPLRIVQIHGFDPLPDGGTQVKSTQEIGEILITDIDYEDHHSIVKYQVAGEAKKPTTSVSPTTTLQAFQNELDTVAAELQNAAAAKKDVTNLRLIFLGRHGKINQLTKLIRALPQKDKGKAGLKLNQLKAKILDLLKLQPRRQKLKTSWFDPTMPAISPPVGRLHPITKIFNEVEDIFARFGFTIATGPEIEWDEINFQKLRLGPDHPSRDTQETYYFDQERLLRVHTSSVQIRYMQSHKPPIRIISPGRVYRRDQIDATHLPSFHQIEGLLVDDRTSLTDLLGMLEHTVKQLFGPQRAVRFYGHNFPYTEPSLEVEVQTKSGQWLEVVGCGMVHPQVLENCHIQSSKYIGWAFGMGADRLAMLKYDISDIRSLYSGDLRFLKP